MTMTEYRIAEEHNRFRIQYSNGMVWHDLSLPHVPRFFDTLQDARSWVATIKRGVVYHDAEISPMTEDDLKWEYSRPILPPIFKITWREYILARIDGFRESHEYKNPGDIESYSDYREGYNDALNDIFDAVNTYTP
jgi:hypothetical protein